jgi:hypothetical protein
MYTTRLMVIAGAAMLVAGCAGHDDQDVTATTTAALEPSLATSTEAIASIPGAPTLPVFVTLESPYTCEESCAGGFWVRELNSAAAPRWVEKLDVSELSRSAVAQASGAGPGELLMRGTFTSPALLVGMGTFHALEAWRGLPDVAAPPLDPYLGVMTVDGALVAHVLDSPWGRVIGSISVADLATPFVDTAWLSSRIVTGGAVVAGKFDGWALDVAQVYLRLPDVAGPCPDFGYECGDAVPTFTLAAGRCLIPTGCAVRRMCPEVMPACGSGYETLSWPSQPDGCLAFACMPAWLDQ